MGFNSGFKGLNVFDKNVDQNIRKSKQENDGATCVIKS